MGWDGIRVVVGIEHLTVLITASYASPGIWIWEVICQIWGLCHSEGESRRRWECGNTPTILCSSPVTIRILDTETNLNLKTLYAEISSVVVCWLCTVGVSRFQWSMKWRNMLAKSNLRVMIRGWRYTCWSGRRWFRKKLTSFAFLLVVNVWIWRRQSCWPPWQCWASHREGFQGTLVPKVLRSPRRTVAV